MIFLFFLLKFNKDPANDGTQNEKKNEENGQKPAEEKTENEMEGKQDKKNAVDKDKEDGHKTIENPVAKKTTEPLEVSSPESVRSVREFSESSSEDEPESSSSSDEGKTEYRVIVDDESYLYVYVLFTVSATKNGKRRMYTRKQSSKRVKPSPKKGKYLFVKTNWVIWISASVKTQNYLFKIERKKS